jgi:hypothetical protein
MRKVFPLFVQVIALTILLSLNSCDKDDAPPMAGPFPAGPNLTFYALTGNAQLLKINAMDPQTIQTTINITGLQPNEKLLSIDFRPATGQLYGIGSSSRVYVINLASGAARAIGVSSFSPKINTLFVSMDFNPTVDRIRLVASDGQNLRLNPETGAVAAIDGNINGVANAFIGGVGYTGNTAGSASTILYDIDVVNDKLYKQDPPNNGTLVEVGSLGFDVSVDAGLDIAPNGTALAILGYGGGKPNLFTIDLTTGAATRLGPIAGNAAFIVDIAIPTNPVAYAVDNAGTNLLIFNLTAPGTPVSKAITGLQAGETILGLDFRPANAQLYALGSTSRIYTINASSGAAAVVGTAPFTPALSGTSFGFDFNPTVDRIRIVSNTGQNLRLNPETGALAATDGSLNPGTPSVSAAAYTNNFAGATTTSLFVIDANTDKLYLQNPPNNGTLVEVGSLGINVELANGFDIGSTSNTAYALLTVGAVTKLYSINLASGAATSVADFPAAAKGFTIGTGF